MYSVIILDKLIVDYSGYSRANAIPITFPPRSNETIIEILIINDPLVEGTERFFGRIISGGGISDLIIHHTIAVVDITGDNECYNGKSSHHHLALSPLSLSHSLINVILTHTTVSDSACMVQSINIKILSKLL